MKTKTAVAILNYNGVKYLKLFLPNVIEHTKADGVKIIVIDNASTDNSCEFVKSNFPEVQLIVLDKNYGFAGGYNEGLKYVEAEYYALINSDIELTENWLNQMVDFMDANNDVAACQPKVLSYSERNKFEYAGACGGFIDKFGYAFCRGRIVADIEEDKGQYDTEKQIFWATGACFLIRSELFKKIEGFDSDFFAHFEEIDLCWRLQNLGYNIYCLPQSFVYHVGGGTLSYQSPLKLYLNYRNNLYALHKNLPAKYFKRRMLIRLVLDNIAAFRYLFRGEFQNLMATLKAHYHYTKNLQKLRQKRCILKKRYLNEPSKNVVFNNSIIFNYFIKKKKYFSELNW